MTAVILCTMALVDGALAGFRAWAGRDGRVVKQQDRVRSGVRGVIAAAVALVAIAAVLLVIMDATSVTYGELVDAGNRMAVAYAPFCVAVALGFLGYFSASLESQALSTVIILGPATFLRPIVILAGAIYAAWGASAWVVVAAFSAVVIVLAVEPIVGRRFARELQGHPFGSA